MQPKKKAWLTLMVVSMLALTACNIGATPQPTQDVSVIYTSAAQTLIADLAVQQTQTALAVPPTATPTFTLAPTFSVASPIPGVGTQPASGGNTTFPTLGVSTLQPTVAVAAGCNNSAFVDDITVPDGTIMKPGEDFKKTWAIQNTGTCAWTEGYVLAFASGDNMDGYDLPIAKNQSVAPGQVVNMTINMTAHVAEGTYIGYWRMKDPQGNYFGATVYYKIKVQANN